jgi:glycerol-3-phosphate dehydrogenase (NAD(P)+)
MTFGIIGSGAFGTALSISLSSTNEKLILWTRNQDVVNSVQEIRENRLRLPGYILPQNIIVTNDINQMKNCSIILIAVPMQQLRSVVELHRSRLEGKILVACCKGFEVSTGLGPTSILEMASNKTAVLTGPSFAADLASGFPTALTVASKVEGLAQYIQSELGTETLRLYWSDDPIGAEFGGALKNVIAIGCGVTIGAGYGSSSRAALMTRGYSEIISIAPYFGAKPETLSGLSGLGDLSLTCMSSESRNYRYGLALGKQQSFDKNITVEGTSTSSAIILKAKEFKLDTPVMAAINNLVVGKVSLSVAIQSLLSRPPKKE